MKGTIAVSFCIFVHFLKHATTFVVAEGNGGKEDGAKKCKILSEKSCGIRPIDKFMKGVPIEDDAILAKTPELLCHERIPNTKWTDSNGIACPKDTSKSSSVAPIFGKAAMQAAPDCVDAVIINSGMIRSHIGLKDTLTVGDVKALHPFSNTINVISLKGFQIRHLLEDAMAGAVGWFRDPMSDIAADYPQAYNIRFDVDLNENFYDAFLGGGRAMNVEYFSTDKKKWMTLEDDDCLNVLVVGYNLRGGNGYLTLRDAAMTGSEQISLEGYTDRALFSKFAQKKKEIRPVPMNKMSTKSYTEFVPVCE